MQRRLRIARFARFVRFARLSSVSLVGHDIHAIDEAAHMSKAALGVMERHAWKMHMVILTLKWSHVLIDSSALHQVAEFVIHLLHLALGEWALHAHHKGVADSTSCDVSQ